MQRCQMRLAAASNAGLAMRGQSCGEDNAGLAMRGRSCAEDNAGLTMRGRSCAEDITLARYGGATGLHGSARI